MIETADKRKMHEMPVVLINHYIVVSSGLELMEVRFCVAQTWFISDIEIVEAMDAKGWYLFLIRGMWYVYAM